YERKTLSFWRFFVQLLYKSSADMDSGNGRRQKSITQRSVHPINPDRPGEKPVQSGEPQAPSGTAVAMLFSFLLLLRLVSDAVSDLPEITEL
ncbi:hypothetical protein J6590_006331, partial [Homalodisca vitripennis]